jgi:hypothetical protein
MKHGAVGLNVADRTYIAGGFREVAPPSISQRSVDSACVRPEDARAGMPRFDAARNSPTSRTLGAKQTLATSSCALGDGAGKAPFTRAAALRLVIRCMSCEIAKKIGEIMTKPSLGQAMSIKVKYQRGVLSASELNAIVEGLIEEANQDSDLEREIRDYGLQPSDLRAPEAFKTEQAYAGVDIVDLYVVLSGKAVHDVWKYVFLPRIVQRFGADAVGDEGGRDEGEQDGSSPDQ